MEIHGRLIVDLDGSLCNNQHRENLLSKGKDANRTEAWDAFNKACIKDDLIVPTYNLIKALQISFNYHMLFVTGRSAVCRDETEQWLERWGFHGYELRMRAKTDHRKAVEFKKYVFGKMGLTEKDVVLEDDPAIIEMVKEEFGCIVIQIPSKCAAVVAGMSQSGE